MHAVRVTVICDECVRIEYAPQSRFCDLPSLFAIHGPAGDPSRIPEMGLASRVFTTSADAGSPAIVFRTRRMMFEYRPDGRAPHAGNMRSLIEHPAPPGDVDVEEGRVVWAAGARNKHNLGGTLSTLDGLRGPHPLGEGLFARDGWHVVDDSLRHVLVDGWATSREHAGLGGNTDWYLFAYGDDYGAALRAMTIIGGRVPMPRRCLLGSWYSRYWPYTSDEYRGIVDEFEVHGFPLDVLVLDMDWHKPGWTGWSWNRELLPDAEDLLHWLHTRGLAVTLNLHPADGVGPHEDKYADFMRAIGREPDGSTVPFDAGNREYMRALFEKVHKPLEESGVDFWWVDWQQDKFVRSIPGLTNLRWLNHLYFEHMRRGPESIQVRQGAAGHPKTRRGVSFSRWATDDPNPDPAAGTEWGHPTTGGWGDHRYPIHFSGDAHTGWKMLAFQVPFTVTAGNIGCFFWSHDIGGHFGPRLEEATARWVQFGALSAALRVHSARTGSLDRRPWTSLEHFCESMRRAYELRSRLMPYLYSSVRACHEDALPLLRPMYLGWPREERAYRVPGQYMLGEDVLCAPIVTPGIGERCVASRHVWFPPGSSSAGWHDLETGERHEAGDEGIVVADIDRVPVFARAGVLLPMRPITHRMTSEPLETLVLTTFAGADGEVCERELYEDDGISLGYERGEWARTPLRAAWRRVERDGCDVVKLEATIGPMRGQYAGCPARRSIELRVGGVRKLIASSGAQKSELVAGAAGTAVLRVRDVDSRSSVQLSVEFEPSDSGLIARQMRTKSFAAALGKHAGPLDERTLRERVVAACRADSHASSGGGQSVEHRQRLLEIGGGIGAIVEADSVRLVDTLGWIDHSAVNAEMVDRLGTAETIDAVGRVELVGSDGGACVIAIELPERAIPAPRVGLRSSRIARFRFEIDGAPMVVEATAETALAPLTEFLVVGPFAWDWHNSIHEVVCGPEGNLARGISPADVFDGRDGARVSWRPAATGAKWDVDLRTSLHARGGLAYAATSILATRAQHATFHFECGDKLIAWLNGEKIITLDDHSPHGAPEPSARVKLREGRNELVIKTTDGGGGWGFAVSAEGAHELIHERPGSAWSPPAMG
jgi:hypothetical protein